MRSVIGAAALAVAVAAAPPVLAQDPKVGQRLAVACQACHGMDGLSKMPEAPHLAGQPVVYLERSLRAYRSGERRHETMSVVAKMLSDDDIRNLAAYFASIPIEVRAPQ